MTITAILCLRNEAAFLLDWLAFHRACGIDHVVALSNDCDDGTDAMLDRLQDLGGVTHIRNDGPYGARGVQFTGLNRAAETAAVKQADWLIALDIDEFVNVHVGTRTLPDLLAALPQATAIPLTWRLFGNADVTAYEDRPVPHQFTRAAPHILHWPWRASMFKTLYRNDGTYGLPGVHRPRRPDRTRLAQQAWFDGSGRRLPQAIAGGRTAFSDIRRNNHRLVQLNHYALGARESYLLKVARGRAVHDADRLGMDYWVERNFNTEEDSTILRLRGVAAERAGLASDPTLANLHARAVQWRHDRLAALMRDEAYRALFGRLMVTPGSIPMDGTVTKRLINAAVAAGSPRKGE